jgi:hypothetical protein
VFVGRIVPIVTAKVGHIVFTEKKLIKRSLRYISIVSIPNLSFLCFIYGLNQYN